MIVYQLLIDGTGVLTMRSGVEEEYPVAPPAGGVSLVSLERNYDDPAKLVFRCHCDWRSPPYAADSVVELLRADVAEADEGWDPVVVFRGLLDLPRPLASDHDYPCVEYTAYDLRRALDFVAAMHKDDGSASIRLDAGPLQTVVYAYLQHIVDPEAAYGVAATVEYVGGAEAIQTLPVSLDAETIDGGFRRIAAAAPGVRVFLRPPEEIGGMSYYVFVNIFGAPAYDLVMDETRIPDLSIQQSIDGCAGAVKTLQGFTVGNADVSIAYQETLNPAWNPALESAWTLRHAFTRDNQGNETELAKVYRQFSFAHFIQPITASTFVVGLVLSEYDDVNPVWQQVSIAKLNLSASLVLLNLPAIMPLGSRRYNPHEPGRAKPGPARLAFSRAGEVSTPIIINSYRWPPEGYAGIAYQLAPITCGYEKVVQVPAEVNAEAYVRDAHAAVSEPITSGQIPIRGDLPDDPARPEGMWLLSRRINVTTGSHGDTGHEALRAPLMGFRVDFAGGVSATLDLEYDRSEMLERGT